MWLFLSRRPDSEYRRGARKPQIIPWQRALPYDQISNEARARREQSLLFLLYKDGHSLTVNRENFLLGCLRYKFIVSPFLSHFSRFAL